MHLRPGAAEFSGRGDDGGDQIVYQAPVRCMLKKAWLAGRDLIGVCSLNGLLSSEEELGT
jgi:hypothetical protein